VGSCAIRVAVIQAETGLPIGFCSRSGLLPCRCESDVLAAFIPDENSELFKIPGFPVAQVTLLDS
jgi:hypothetical protein